MICSNRNRSRLLVGCGSAALALALTIAPQRAAAQAVNASGNVTTGAAVIDNPSPGQTTVSVITPTTIIDWTPFVDNNGDALVFLPAGNTLLFGSGQQPNFAVLNRILPSANNNIAVIDGNVISQVTNPLTGAPGTGGFVAFYSPTGLLIGSTATFDVGSLLLTTLDTTPASFDNFANGGNLSLQAAPGSTARIQINPGAQISALAENSFFAVVAADVEMLGTARVNGSHAYVAGEVVNLQVSNGLFNISIPVGTAAAGEVVTVNGDVGGPSSTGVGDNHILYAVARAQQDPISMLFSGNLGFDPAQSAGIVNGEILLAANYNVFGRNVDTGSISQGIGAVFRDDSSTSDVRADITLDDFAAGSSVLAIGTGQVIASGNSSVRGDLLLVGRDVAAISVVGDDSFEVSGDVLVDARDYGVVSSSLQTLDAINATGTTAQIVASGGATVLIGGNALVAADAFGGADDLNRIAGSSQGGLAEIDVTGATLAISGLTTVTASGRGTNLDFIRSGAPARGGTARVTVSGDGSAAFSQDLLITAVGAGTESDPLNPSTVSNAFGGTALLSITGLGTINVDGNATLNANAVALAANAAGGGALADAGEAAVAIDGAGTIIIDGGLNLTATALGGNNGGGQGGQALGGAARASTVNGGEITVMGEFRAAASAIGGDGLDGGDAFGGVAGANAITGTINLLGSATAFTSATGGDASIGFGGTGGVGRGGNAFFQADGTLNETAALSIALDASVIANGFGGRGGQADDGAGVEAGTGGIGYGGDAAVPNQADTNFNSGAYLLAGGDNGSISVGGAALVNAVGTGGNGGFGNSTQDGGLGGDGFGGVAVSGLLLFGTDGSLGQGRANFGSLSVIADGFGGRGGFSTGDFPSGEAGDGTGGRAILSVQAGDVTASGVDLLANGIGGGGSTGGVGTGGEASLSGGLGGTATLGFFNARTFGIGGEGFPGGAGFGGDSFIRLDGIDLTVDGDVNLTANGTGGISFDGPGADGTGGRAFIEIEDATAPGIAVISGNAAIEANGFGGIADFSNLGGRGTGGTAYVQAQGGGLIRLGSLQVTASGLGGEADPEFDDTTVGGDGGDGIGGTAELRSFGTGSEIIIERNTPVQFSGPANGGGAILAALGIGGDSNGGNGVGGDGIGGNIGVLARQGGSIALPADPTNDPGSVGLIQLLASGFGGGSSVDGGLGGMGIGGNGAILADGAGSTIIMGDTIFTVMGEGGSSALSTSNVDGGNAFGGDRRIRVINGGEATLELIGGSASALGGDGSGAGDGGDATTGVNLVELVNGTLNIIGTLQITDDSTGGSGNRGGDVFSEGESGVLSFSATDSFVDFTPNAMGQAGIVIGGTTSGGTGVIAGGNAEGIPVGFALNNTDLSGVPLRIAPRTVGGNATSLTGVGGTALGGLISVAITNSMLDLQGDTLIMAESEGGDGGTDPGGVGGAATSGPVTVALTNSAVTIGASPSGAGTLRVRSVARGGDGAVVGNAISGQSALMFDATTLTADQVLVESAAFADLGMGALARSGDAIIAIAGDTQIAADRIRIAANASTGPNGNSEAGTATLRIAAGSSTATVTADMLDMEANAFGADPFNLANGAGRLSVDIASGNVDVSNFNAFAFGDTFINTPLASEIRAVGGNINVSDTLTVSVFGDLLIETGAGGIIGAPRAAATTTGIFITSNGEVVIAGDDNVMVGLGGDAINITANDVDILSGARVGADRVFITSLNDTVTATLGGADEGMGFSLTADNLSRISARELGIALPRLTQISDPNLPDALVRDASLTGSGDNGFALVSLSVGSDFPDGLVRFEGTLTYANAGIDDLLEIEAGRIEIVTPGGIRVTGANGAPSGRLDLSADDIWIADAATIAQLQADRNFAGRDAQLAVAAAGSDDPLGYVRAAATSINITSSLLVRNTGVEFAGGGLLVGDGGLSIATSAQQSPGGALDVFAYGRRQTGPDTFVVGEEFFNEVNYNRVSPGNTIYLDASAFNDCIINTGVCPQAPEPPQPPEPEAEAPIEINNPTVFEEPIFVGEPRPDGAGDDDRFGIDFPDQLEAPLISEDPLLDDPVTSGGDATVYGAGSFAPAGGQ